MNKSSIEFNGILGEHLYAVFGFPVWHQWFNFALLGRMVAPQYHFISGLPRSGSTLLAALLLQNPRFHAGMSSPVGGMFTAMVSMMSAGSEFSPQFADEQKRRLVRGLFDGYYGPDHGKQVIFDTNRMWCAKMTALQDLFPGAKIIACVRNVAWIMDSIERLFHANPYENTRLFGGNMGRSTVYTRLEGLAQHDQLVGFAWAALREAFYGAQARSLLVLDYELLTQAPHKVMPLIYQFLEQPAFEHDFDNVAYDAPDYDLQLGTPGLHRVQAKVEYKTRRTIIPPDLFDKYSQMTFWTDPSGSAANVIAPQSQAKGITS